MQILFIVCLPTKKLNHSGNLFRNSFISDTHPGWGSFSFPDNSTALENLILLKLALC